ncbi:MAG: SDR family oxidoreductase [Chloroflexota bacterium]|nr:SDR family oxidoreductase [Chloroflexota bacterium]
MDCHNKNAIVTGGSSGIGKAIAKLLVRRGANVAIIARRQLLLDAALQEFETMRMKRTQVFQALSADISDWEQAQTAISTVTADGRTPDILINAAGLAHPGYFEELPIEIFRRTMEVDFFGTLYPCKLVAPLMIERHSGHIVNFSSVAGFIGVFGYTAYGAAKFAIRGFSDALRAELKPHGVHVSVVFPPDTDTPQLHYENQFKPLETRRLASSAGLLKPEQVAQAVIKGIEKNHYVITPGFESTFYFWLTNGPSGLIRWYTDRVVARARKERNRQRVRETEISTR